MPGAPDCFGGDDVLFALAGAYGLDGLDPAGWEAFGDGMRLVRHGGRILVAKRHWMLTADRATLFDAVLGAVTRARLAPHHLRTAEGTYTLRLDGGWYGLMEHVVAEPAHSGKGLARAGRAVASLHRTLATVPGRADCPRAVDRPEAERLLGAAGLHDAAARLADRERAVAELPAQLTHRDLHAGNFLFTPDRAWVLDYDSFATGPRVADALFAAYRLSGGEERGMARFLAAYAEVVPLTAVERAAGLSALAQDFAHKLAFVLYRDEAGDATFDKDRENYAGFVRGALALAARRPGGLDELEGVR